MHECKAQPLKVHYCTKAQLHCVSHTLFSMLDPSVCLLSAGLTADPAFGLPVNFLLRLNTPGQRPLFHRMN